MDHLGIIKKWSDFGLATKILIAMVAGILLGMLLHQLDRPLKTEGEGAVKSIAERLEAAGVSDEQVQAADKNGDGAFSRSELEALASNLDGSLDPTVETAVVKLAKDPNPLMAFLLAEKDGIAVLKKYANEDGLVGRKEIDQIRTAPEVSVEGRAAARELKLSKWSGERIQSGNGLSIARVLALAGDLFLGLIKTIVIPLVFIAVFVGIAGNEDFQTVKRIGGGILLYFLLTTFISVSIGSSLAVAFSPGKKMPAEFKESQMAGSAPPEIQADSSNFRQKFQQFLPKNPFGSLSAGNTLEVVLFAALFGTVILLLRQGGPWEEKASMLLSWFEFLLEICMTIVRWAMYLAPIGVFGLMTDITAEVGLSALISLAGYAGTVILGLVLLLVFYSVVVKVVGGRSPIEFFKNIYPLQMLAFSTSSSAAVMPSSLETAEEKNKVHPAIARFTIPLGATINMDGTALYQAVAAVFLLQVYGMPVTIGAVGLILVTAIMASVGTPGTPGVGIVVLAGILESAGVPAAGIGMIIGVDRLLDMCRTAINVTGDQTACLVMERIAGSSLQDTDDYEKHEKASAAH